MTRARPVPLRALQVHAPVPPAQPARPWIAPAPSGRGGFAQLLRTRRAAAPPVDALDGDEADADAAVPVAPAREREPGGDGERGRDERDAPPEAAHDNGLDDWAGSLVPSASELDALLAHAVAPVAARAPQVPATIRSIADTIANFSNERAVSDSEGWNVRIVLRPDVIADTTLELGVSPHWLQVRFLTGDPRSRALLYEHAPTLRTLLENALARQRDIAIDID